MKFYATIDEQTFEVCIEGTGKVTIDGEPVEADMQRLGQPDLYSLLLNNASHDVVVEPDATQRGQYGVLLAGKRYSIRVQDERTRRLVVAERKAQQGGGEVSVRAPIPGLVVKVLVTPGQEVAEDEPLIILEAMKMENDLRAPRAGVVHEVRVAPGAQVALGQVLVSIRSKEG